MKKRTATPRKKLEKTGTRADSGHKITRTVAREAGSLGWSQEALSAAAHEYGLPKEGLKLLYPNGVPDAVTAFIGWVDDEMLARIEAERGYSRMRVRDKVGFGVRARLEILAPYKDAIRRLILWSMRPNNALQSLKQIGNTADIIWKAAGDTSTDYNFYTKRILLSGVMKATTLYWLQDESPDHAATWDFLDRRINDVVRVGKSISLASEWQLPDIINAVKARVMG